MADVTAINTESFCCFIFLAIVLKSIDMSAQEKSSLNNIRLSCNALKLVACIFMLIDHIGYGIIHNYMVVHGMDLLPDTYKTLNTVYEIFRGVGRLAFPIFCFFLVEGFLRTSNVKKYAIRLFVFALVSEIPFDLGLYGAMFKWDHQNIILTFFIALLMLISIRYLESNVLALSRPVVYLTLFCAVVAFADLAYILKTDYSWKCMLLVAVLYFFRKAGTARLLCGAVSTCWEKYAPISFLLLYFYDPSVRPKHKYAFYIFYPLNFIIIYIIAKLII